MEKPTQPKVQLFVTICQLPRIKPVLMTQANRFKETPDPAPPRCKTWNDASACPNKQNRLLGGFDEEIRAVGKGNGGLFIDLAAAIPAGVVNFLSCLKKRRKK